MDVVGGQRPAQDLSQVNELFVCLFVSPLVITCFHSSNSRSMLLFRYSLHKL